jgi:hypothetical protein
VVSVEEAAARVVQVGDEHAQALADFYTAAWGQKVTAEGVIRTRATAAAANFVTPGETPPTFLFLKGERAFGHLGTIPVRFAFRGRPDRPAHWLKGLWVLPEMQNGPVGFLVLKEAKSHLGMAMALVVELPARRLFQAHGFQDLGPLPNAIKLLSPARILRRIDLEAIGLGRFPAWMLAGVRAAQWPPLAALGGGMLAGGIGLWTASLGNGRAVAVGESGLPPRAELDRLFERMRPALAGSVVRDGAYLEHRYGGRRAREYVAVSIRSAGELSGLALLRRPSGAGDSRLRGIQVVVIAELLYPPGDPGLGLALLAAAERATRAIGADAVLLSASHHTVRDLERRRAYLPLPGNVHVMIRVPGGDPALPELGELWLTRGDSEADEAF